MSKWEDLKEYINEQISIYDEESLKDREYLAEYQIFNQIKRKMATIEMVELNRGGSK
jgi:hypothetical protein